MASYTPKMATSLVKQLEALGLSRKQIAERLGVTADAVRRWAAGTVTYPRDRHVLALRGMLAELK